MTLFQPPENASKILMDCTLVSELSQLFLRTRIRLLDESGNSLGQLLRRVKPTQVEPGFYTLVGEVEGEDFDPAKNMRWKLQLVSSVTAPNLIAEKDIQKEFSIKGEKGPYLPPAASDFEPGLLFRYMIGVSTPLEASFHLSANNQKAELKLILKDENEVLNVAGGQHQGTVYFFKSTGRYFGIFRDNQNTHICQRLILNFYRTNSSIFMQPWGSTCVFTRPTISDYMPTLYVEHCIGQFFAIF